MQRATPGRLAHNSQEVPPTIHRSARQQFTGSPTHNSQVSPPTIHRKSYPQFTGSPARNSEEVPPTTPSLSPGEDYSACRVPAPPSVSQTWSGGIYWGGTCLAWVPDTSENTSHNLLSPLQSILCRQFLYH